MKKVLLLFSAILFAVGSAFAAAVPVTPTSQYNLKFKVQTTGDVTIYAKAFTEGLNNDFIEVNQAVTAAETEAAPIVLESGLVVPTGNLTGITQVLFDYRYVPAGTTITVSELQILDAEGNDILADAELSAGTPYYATGPSWTVTDNYTFTVENGVSTVYLGDYTEQDWQAQFPINVSGPEVEPEPVKGPDQLFLRGDSFEGWHDNETDPANMPEYALATTTDNIHYVWDWSAEPVELRGLFKFGRLQTEAEAAVGEDTYIAWANIVNGAYGGVASKDQIADYGTYELTTTGLNFNVTAEGNLLVSRIEIDLSAMTLTVSYDEPTAVEEAEALAVSASNGRIYADGEFQIFNMAGQDVTADNGNLYGLYIVVAGDEAVKVIVK